MARTTKTIGFTVPPKIADEFEKTAKREQRTKSELFREVWRMYQTYQERLRAYEEERFDRLMDEAIEDGLREKANPTLTAAQHDAIEERLVRVAEDYTKKSGIQLKDVNKIIHEERKARRQRQRT
ncbi:MAG: ribbon-helix-helix protein, CopG family [Gammaproteobacteria bacterium]